MAGSLQRNLQEMRKRADKMTQRELARRTGLSESYISKLEQDGDRDVSTSVLAALGRAFGVDPTRLYDEDTPTPDPPPSPIATVHFKPKEELYPDLVESLREAVDKFNRAHYQRRRRSAR